MSKLHVTEYTIGQIKEQLKFGGYEVDKVYSPPIKEGALIFRILKYLIYISLKTIKSHHILESTVFYSANKVPPIDNNVQLADDARYKEESIDKLVLN